MRGRAALASIVALMTAAPASAPASAQTEAPPPPPGATTVVPTPKQMALPGMTWDSLKALPPLIGSLWVPENVPADERAYLASLSYPPLKRDYLPDARAKVQALIAGKEILPSKGCTFDGVPRVTWYPYPVQFLYAPGNVMLQQHDVIRAATVMGLDHPAELRDKDRLQQFEYYGHEAAMWQGDTLVIDTIAAREETDTFYGVPNDPDLHVVERYRLLSPDRLERRTTVEAPTYFTKPWLVVTTFRRAPEISWATHFCLPKAPKVKQ